MDIRGKNALVLGGFGLVGSAVCRTMMAHDPASLIVASLHKGEAEQAVANLKSAFPKSKTKFIPVWGDIFLRAEWQNDENGFPRPGVLADPEKRQRLLADVIGEMDEDILTSSLLSQLILGKAKSFKSPAADIVIDCINTSTAVAYQNVFASANKMRGLIAEGNKETPWQEEVENLLASLYIPQLVRHIQILHEALQRAGTQAYIKVGTSGTGGMGLNIPYTHGEEKPSRVLMSKAALAGAQTLLTFLMARTPGGPKIVKEIKPSALIAWKEIGYGPIRRNGKDFELYDCSPEDAVYIKEAGSLAPQGEFGKRTGKVLEAVYINTGENGLFAAGDFAAITALGQMEFVTPEEIARNVVDEILGGNTGKDIISALDGAVMGPTFRAGTLREAALSRLKQLSDRHGESVAFEILGPPRMSKLLYEAFLLKQVYETLDKPLKDKPDQMAGKIMKLLTNNGKLRRQIISVGLPILLPDGKRMLRGPVIKSENAHGGWVDLTPENMKRWQTRIQGIREMLKEQLTGDSSSHFDRGYPSLRQWTEDEHFEIGEMAAWVSINEDNGRRGKE
ncbi:MAG: short-chain dehydrogenase [Chloroflexi bacterium]|nr:short-chain dehydrogenase [Chloroflexota bacterium]